MEAYLTILNMLLLRPSGLTRTKSFESIKNKKPMV
jgi:hypothetical protein